MRLDTSPMQTAPMRPPSPRTRLLASVTLALLAMTLFLAFRRPVPTADAASPPPPPPPPSEPGPESPVAAPAGPSRLERAHQAWQAFLAAHPSYDPVAELLVVPPLGLPAAEPDLERALDLLEPALDASAAPDRIEVARLTSQILQALRNERAHLVVRTFLPRLVRDYPRDDGRVEAAILQCLDAALTPPREWAVPALDDGRIRRETVEALLDSVAALAASETSPSRGALWRCMYVAFLHALFRPPAVCESILAGTDVAALSDDQVWRYHYVRSRVAERAHRWDELASLYAAGLAVAPTTAVRLYFEKRHVQVRFRAVMSGH